MGFHKILSPSQENQLYYDAFVQGHEPGLTYIYHHLSGSIRRYGFRIVQDEFVVNTIVQEAFLKLWAFRERMTSMDHIAHFLKLTMRWECMGYYRHPMETLYRKALRLNWMETSWDIAVPLPEDDLVQTENQLHLVRSMIPRLTSHRLRTIVGLYAKDGMTVSQIAKRLHCTTQLVTRELHQGLDQLRAILARPKGEETAPAHVATVVIRPIEGLNNEQSHIMTLRREMKYSFSQIADLLKLPQSYVQKQYVDACKKMDSRDFRVRRTARA